MGGDAHADRHDGTDGLLELLDEECERSYDRLNELIACHVGARAFRASLDDNAPMQLEGLFRRAAAAYLAQCQTQTSSLDEMLALPGMELLDELWLGPHQ